MPTTTLHLVRHGQALHDESGDPGLTSFGQRQAHAAGLALRGITADVVLHSRRRRAIETAGVIAASIGTPAQLSDLVEDRTPVPRDWDGVPARYHRALRAVPDEEADHGARRLEDAVRQLSQVGTSDRAIVAVTHNFVIGWFVRSVLDMAWWRWIGLDQQHGAITTIQWSHDCEPRLLRFNERGRLPSR